MRLSRSYRYAGTRAAAFAACLALAAAPSWADDRTGSTIYAKACAACHGPAGAGTKKYPDPLAGERSLAQLTKYVGETMPEDNPGTLSAAEAARVSEYIHSEFYSKAARERNKAPRIELARLTVRQYRGAVADLVGSFRGRAEWDDKRGLRGDYFNSRGWQNDKKVLNRVDPELHFDFGKESPVPGKVEPGEFYIHWEGSLLAPETGEYAFTVKSDHSTKMFLNDMNRPLIDAWVRSSTDKEFTESAFLVAGRIYPVKVEMSKAKQGVNDKKKDSRQDASISLEWKAPDRAREVIPSRYLSPNGASESYAVATAFPPDDRSYGWERGTTISKAWEQSETEAALEAAAYVAAKLNELAGTKDGAPDRPAKLKEFARKFAERAFRKPLADEQKKQLIDRQFEIHKDPEAAVKRVVVLALISPRFLYREVGATSNAYDVASRLSFALWDSPPDEALMKAAAADKLKAREQVVAQAERMVKDPRAQAKIRQFLFHWLRLDDFKDIAKDNRRFPGFDPATIADLRTSLELFLDDVAFGKSSDFRQLLLADELFLNDRLSEFYGAPLPAPVPFRKTKLAGQPRAGILTHPYMMATFAYTAETSPIHRGVFLARNVLGVSLKPPPEAFSPLAADLHPGLTTRERVILQTKPAACAGCHSIINPLGFTLENYDAVGRFRCEEKKKPIDAHGSYLTRAGEKRTFADVRDLARFLADSPEVHAAFAEQMFHHLAQQSVRAYGADRAELLRKSFAAGDYSIRKLAVEAAVVAATTDRDVPAIGHTTTSK